MNANVECCKVAICSNCRNVIDKCDNCGTVFDVVGEGLNCKRVVGGSFHICCVCAIVKSVRNKACEEVKKK